MQCKNATLNSTIRRVTWYYPPVLLADSLPEGKRRVLVLFCFIDLTGPRHPSQTTIILILTGASESVGRCQ